MKQGIKLRLTIFIATIVLLVGLIGWTAHSSWERINGSHQKLAELQWQSMLIADHLQQKILQLNNSIYLYAAYPPRRGMEDDWTNIMTACKQLQDWLDAQEPILSTKTERPLLDRINQVYKDYLEAAEAVHTRIYGLRRAITRVDELADFEAKSKQLLDLGFQLAQDQQASLEDIRQQNMKSLDALRLTLFGALGLLVLAGFCLAVIVYREMISPLKAMVQESKQIAERQEKLASLGMLAAGVAHEIRNPLTAIKAWLYLQQKHLTPGTPEHGDAELIGGEINRLERIVKDFLQFARPSEPEFKLVTAGESLKEVQTLLQPECEKAKIELVLDDCAPLKVRIDQQQIKQVLINLVRNAAESIGENGTITLRVRADEKRMGDRLKPVAILEVSDTGEGLSPEAEKRLFDPFFTTKDSGTGLGLPIAARIVEKHQGVLQYQRRPERGTTFAIVLPRIN